MYLFPIQVSWALNQKLAVLDGDPGISMNERGSSSNTESSNKTSLNRRIPNSFLI